MKLNLYFKIMLPFIFSFSLYAQAQSPNDLVNFEKDKNSVSDFCSSYRLNKAYLEKMSNEILMIESKRKILVDGLLKNEFKGCRLALDSYINQLIDKKIDNTEKGVYGFVTLALMLKVPQAQQFIEQEISLGVLGEWGHELEIENPETFGKALKSWSMQMARGLRKLNENISSTGETKAPELIRIWNPILMSKYISFLSKNLSSVTDDDLRNIDALYACSTTSFREVFVDKLSKIMRYSSENWVKIIRQEDPWILFRIMPLMVATSDGNVKRELVWLTENHPDLKIRTIAEQSLDKMAIRSY